MSVTFGAA